jgi:hypothetical protein
LLDLSVDDAPAPNTCARQRGLTFEPGAGSCSARASTVVRTEAADTLIARMLTFQHVAPGSRMKLGRPECLFRTEK